MTRYVRKTYSLAPSTLPANQAFDFTKHEFDPIKMGAGLSKCLKFILALTLFLLSGFFHSEARSVSSVAPHSTVYILHDSFNAHFLNFANYDVSVIKKSGTNEKGLSGHFKGINEPGVASEEDLVPGVNENHFRDNALITHALLKPHVLSCRISFVRKRSVQADSIACYLFIQKFQI
ncbi:MAG: hypothetical protein ACYC1Q_10725 [Bacteroidia bacterium]